MGGEARDIKGTVGYTRVPTVKYWEYPGTYPSVYSGDTRASTEYIGGTQVPTQGYNHGGTRVSTRTYTLEPDTYPSILSDGDTRVPTRVYYLGVSRYLSRMWGYSGTYPSVYSGDPGTSRVYYLGGSGYLPDVFWSRIPTQVFYLMGIPGYLPEYTIWGYPGIYREYGGTQVPTRAYTLETRVPTRVYYLGRSGYLPGVLRVPRNLPEYIFWEYWDTYTSIFYGSTWGST